MIAEHRGRGQAARTRRTYLLYPENTRAKEKRGERSGRAGTEEKAGHVKALARKGKRRLRNAKSKEAVGKRGREGATGSHSSKTKAYGISKVGKEKLRGNEEIDMKQGVQKRGKRERRTGLQYFEKRNGRKAGRRNHRKEQLRRGWSVTEMDGSLGKVVKSPSRRSARRREQL